MSALIRFFLENKVAANLLAAFLVFMGAIAGASLIIRLFPETELYAVNVVVPYPGASPEEVEEAIVEPIEERLEGLEGVRKITAVAAENRGNVVVELFDGEDTEERVNDVRTRVSQITVFPQEAEEPQISELEAEELVAHVILAGDIEPFALKRLAQQSRDRLANSEAISRAEIAGVSDYLIDIAVSEARMRALGLSLPGLAQLIGRESLDLSGGEIEGEQRRSLVRTIGENETGAEFERIIVARSQAGAPIRLADIADVRDDLAETPLQSELDGRNAVAVLVFRSGDETVFDIIGAVRDELDLLNERLPAGVSATLWRDSSVELDARIQLLLKNALIGLFLVTTILLLFLDVRIAFWVAIGVGVSFIGALILMSVFDIAISQLSLFGFILAIGIVVDDAIVVGENIHAETERGFSGKVAARRGVLRVVGPVLFAVSTSIFMFLPLIFLPGLFGQFLGAIAAVVIFVLFMSLIESFFILPRHLSHLSHDEPGKFTARRYVEPVRRWTSGKLDAFSERRLRPAIALSVDHPVATILCATGLLVATFALFSSGLVKFVFFPGVEGNYLTAELELAESASADETRAIVADIVEAADRAGEAIGEDVGASRDDVLEGVYWTLGAAVGLATPAGAAATGGAAANKAFITLKMQDAAVRKFNATEFENAWRAETGDVPGAQTLTFSADLTGNEAAVTIQVSGDEKEAREVVAKFREEIEMTPGSRSVRDDRFRTTEEAQISLLPAGRALGLTLEDVARQVRAGFFGAEAVRIQRDREEIEVRVRYTEEERSRIASLENQRIFFEGRYIPLSQVADVSVGEAPSIIQRKNGQRVFTLRADVDLAQTTGGAIANTIFNEVWPAMRADYPNVSVTAGGEQEEQARTQAAMQRNFLIAIFAVYALLALAFGSYTQPLVVLLAIPFGLIGAFVGHALLGLNLTLLSMFGVIGLSGVIINDALLMIDFINGAIEDGVERRKAIIESSVGRFRPIMLTSLTTFLGVTPIILETSVQAAFLVPTAVALGFGILFGTVVLMVLVPAAAMLHLRSKDQVQDFLERRFGWYDDDEADHDDRGARASAP